MESQSHVETNDAPLISVVIPTYNRRRYVVESLESVLHQSFGDFEILVVDDGSTDGTEEVLRPYGDRIRYLRQENRGAAAARNLGIRSCRGRCVAFMDSDDLATPQHLEKLYDFLARNPNFAMVIGNGAYLGGKSHHRTVVIPAKRARRMEKRGVTLKDLFDGRVFRLQGCMARKAALEEIGLLDERFQVCHDLDMVLRLAQRYAIGFVNEIVFLYRKHGSHVSADDELRSRENLGALEKFLARYPQALDLIGRRVFFRLVAHRYYRLAKALAGKGDAQGAREAIRRAVSLRPLSLKYRLCQLRTTAPG